MMGIRRHLSNLSCRIIAATLPKAQRHWARAIRAETDKIVDDGSALSFAAGAMFGILRDIILTQFRTQRTTGGPAMALINTIRSNPQRLGILCAFMATMLGMVYLVLAGAPYAMIAINLGALVLGLTLLAPINGIADASKSTAGYAAIIAALLILATSLFGQSVDGAARWVSLGRLSVQPSLILLPVVLLTFVRTRTWLSTGAAMVSALAVAIQPDRAMASVMMVALTLFAIMRVSRVGLAAAFAGWLAFIITLIRPEDQPAVPFVDQIIFTSFDVNLLAGLAVLGGLCVLLVPAIAAITQRSGDKEICLIFGVIWLTIILAAVIGNFPTPVVGYSGSAILGYVLSLAALPRKQLVTEAAANGADDAPKEPHNVDPLLMGVLAD